MAIRMAAGVSFLCLGLGGALAAFQQAPVFRSGVELVTVDVTVLDGKGNPIRGLQEDRFAVTVDGAPRRVAWVEYVGHDPAPLDPSAPVESFSSNEHAVPGRVILLAVDQLHIRRVEGLPALRAAADFIDQLEPRDLVAAVPLEHYGPLAFTSRHAQVKRQLSALTGSASFMPVHFTIGLSEALAISDGSRTRLDMVVRRECGDSLARMENPRRRAEADGVRDPCPVQVEQEGRALAQQARTEARLSLNALMRLISQLAEIEGPKTLVFVSEGLVAEPQLIDLTPLGVAAQAARVTIYVLQLEQPLLDASTDVVSPTLLPDLQLRTDGLARLSGSARGALFHLVGADPYPFKRILREISGHYLVAFEATDADRDGRTHRIAVKVSAADTIVRARPAFRIDTTPPPVGTGTELERLLRAARLSTELPLRLAAYTFQQTETGDLKVILTAETDHAGGGREVTMGFVVVDDRGVIVASGGGETGTGRFSMPATMRPGRYLVRAAVVGAGGRQGSVERRFDARLTTAGRMQLSDLMIAEAAGDAAAPLRPAVARASGDRMVLYLEAYAPAGPWPADASITIDVTGSGGGAPLVSAPASVRPAGAGRWTAAAEVSLATLAPGPYMAAARITVPGAPPRRITRSFVVAKQE